MKKNLFYILLCLLIVPFIFISCSDEEDEEPAVEITLEKYSIDLASGQTSSINILTGNGGYSATSEDPEVATTSISGENTITVRAVSTEDASTTILIKDSRSKEKELVVNVTKEVVTPLELTLSQQNVNLILDKEETAEIKILNGNSGYTVEYVEDAKEFIEIDDTEIETEGTFIIKALSEGRAEVKVTDSQKKEATVTIIIRSANTTLEEGELLYITGEGAEDGQQVKKTEEDDSVIYEIYTKIEANKPFYFYSLLDDQQRTFSLNTDLTGFIETTHTESEGAILSETGVYRIRLNFETSTATIGKVEDVFINISWTKKEEKFEYVAKGVWQLKDYNVQITIQDWGIEERYRIIFKIDGEREYWGQSSPIYGERPTIDREGYRDMTPITSNEWHNAVFKFPSELCDPDDLSLYYTDITISMTAEKNYTHDFHDWYFQGMGDIKYQNPIFTTFSLPDPDVIRGEDGLFYLYATEHHRNNADWNNLVIMKSADLVNWELSGHRVFTDETHPHITNTETARGLWAPTISKVNDQYLLYYSQPGDDFKHAIGVARAPHPTGPFTDYGKLIDSNEIGVDISIDAYLHHENGKNYLFWGSFRGIWVIELTEDGLAIKDGAQKQKLAGDQYEAVYIHKRNGYYYLVGSAGLNYQKGGNYHLIVGRSTNLLGPYYDKSGKDMLGVNHEEILKGNTRFTSPGHCSRFITDDSGQDWVLYHSYDGPYDYRILMLDPVYWDEDGWPVVYKGFPSSRNDIAPIFY